VLIFVGPPNKPQNEREEKKTQNLLHMPAARLAGNQCEFQ